MATENLKKLFVEELKDIYSGESQIIKALPKLARAAHSDELRDALEEHLDATKQHKERLEQIFEDLGIPAKPKTCEGIKGIITEGDKAVEDASEKVIDACIIAAAQKVEHYEMATYGTLRTWAQLLGEDKAATLLEQTLEEERSADEALTQLAESFANAEAESGEGAEEEESEEGPAEIGLDESGEEQEEEVGSRGRGRPKGKTTAASRRRDRGVKA
ncbi:MAG TPA: ferritin-like domain-containing protein [Gemmatimonadales bacterium]|jgi:ferritin-like metal-binding protein YciE